MDKLQESIADCDQAIKLNPKIAEPYLNRGIAKGELGNLEEALEDFDKAMELNPEYAEAYWNRVKAKELLGKL